MVKQVPELSERSVARLESSLRGAAERLARKEAPNNHAILLHVRGAEGGDWLIESKEGKMQLSRGRGERSPRAEIASDAQTLLAILEGRKKPLAAFLEGHLRVRGETAYIEQLHATFESGK